MLVASTISTTAHRIAAVPLPPFAMVPVPVSLMIGGLGPSRDQETDGGTDELKNFRANRLMRGPAMAEALASLHGGGRGGKGGCRALLQFSRLAACACGSGKERRLRFGILPYKISPTPYPDSLKLAANPWAKRANRHPQRRSRGAEGPVIGGITTRNQAKTISSTG
jgi:hypothetical protein